MTEQKTWGAVGRELVEKLKGVTDEPSIKASGDAVIQDILRQEATPKERANALRMVNREIMKQYPRLSSEAPAYWYDPKGKESQPKWRHLVFKSLTLSTSDWDEAGDESRREWKEQQQEVSSQVEPASPALEALSVDHLTIDQFQLDDESHQLVQDAIALSGMTLEEFTCQALRVYAKTITGKTRKQSEDLAIVPTDKLRNDPTYSTHPGRAEELTKRAIKAIKYYNANVATENADRWCITQSVIASLTGSRPSTVGKVLEQFKDEIETHNQTYGLNDYSNRKRGKPNLTETIDLAQLVPDGLD
jgi:hypothetical protein